MCRGSAQELKTFEKLALATVGEEKVGIYYGNSRNESKIADEYAHRPKYILIAFTSTIICCEVSMMMCPSTRCTCSPRGGECFPRDMNQMKSCFHTITSGLVVVRRPKGMGAPLESLHADMSAVNSAEMIRIVNRRAYTTGVVSEIPRELNRIIFKKGVGHEAK
ncbi:unnamed protein product [Ectocarpus sp. 12 AP-2014]